VYGNVVIVNWKATTQLKILEWMQEAKKKKQGKPVYFTPKEYEWRKYGYGVN